MPLMRWALRCSRKGCQPVISGTNITNINVVIENPNQKKSAIRWNHFYPSHCLLPEVDYSERLLGSLNQSFFCARFHWQVSEQLQPLRSTGSSQGFSFLCCSSPP